MFEYVVGAGAYVGLFAASCAFEFAYVAWARSAAKDRVASVVAWSVATAGLGLIGVKAALELPLGSVTYLAGIGLGAWSLAYLGQTKAAAADPGQHRAWSRARS
jgi:hypothetical protein